MSKTVRIGCHSAFWGDSAIGAAQLVHYGEIDYLVSDYLAEVTMSIMARARDAKMGYATDFVQIAMKSHLKEIHAKGIKVVTNAGGTNPLACRDAVQAIADELGLELKIGVVLGDDLMAREAEFRAAGTKEMFSGDPFPDQFMSINAYLGGRPIAAALNQGCDIVITGRAVDSAVTLGPLIHEFGWGEQDWDELAQGTLAGHIIECGPQCTGGLFTDWRKVESWVDIGYPVVEVSSDGSFTVAKPPETDGLICFGSVAEQMLYEIGDPGAYMVPDVVCDFTSVRMEEVGENRVRVSGAHGLPATSTYKVSATHRDGYKNQALMVIGGSEAAAKARRTAETILTRTRRMFRERNLGDYSETRIEVIGAEDMYGANSRAGAAREVVMKLAVKHHDKDALTLFAREFAPAGTSMAQGTTGMGSGRPTPSPVVRLFSMLVEKSDVPLEIDIDGTRIPTGVDPGGGFAGSASEHVEPVAAEAATGETMTVPLIKLAYGRSGDKGMNANVGIIARRGEYLPLLRDQLTPERVGSYFAHVSPARVTRFDLPGIGAMNFFLEDALGGGGMASLHTDNLAKAYAQILLDIEIEVPAAWADRLAAA